MFTSHKSVSPIANTSLLFDVYVCYAQYDQ